MPLSYRNQPIDLNPKSNVLFLNDVNIELKLVSNVFSVKSKSIKQ